VIAARFAGVCAVCSEPYRVGSRVFRWGGSWAHPSCAAAERNRRRIIAGETFVGTSAAYRRKVKRD